jgi:hypothetical protein
VGDAFAEAGVEQTFTMYLDRLADPDDPQSDIAVTVVSEAFVGDDEAGARALFAVVADGTAATAALPVAAETVGDASSLTFHEGVEPLTRTAAAWLELRILAGTDVLSVAIVDYAEATPDPDDAVALGERLVERVAAVRDGDAPGLWPLTLQLVAEDGIGNPGPFYLQLDGATQPVNEASTSVPTWLEKAMDVGARADFYEAVDAVDVLFQQQRLRGGRASGDVYFYEAELMRFADEDAAAAYVADLPDRFDGFADGVYDIERLDEAPAAGDEAVAFVVSYEGENDEPYFIHTTHVRVGDVVARVDVMGPELLDDAATEVAEAQAECLADGGCPEPLEAPADLQED